MNKLDQALDDDDKQFQLTANEFYQKTESFLTMARECSVVKSF
jgi:hypothetical protein